MERTDGDIGTRVQAILEDAKVTFAVRYVGVTERPPWAKGQKPWPCDAWSFTLTKGTASYIGDYFTGLGLRERKRPWSPHFCDHDRHGSCDWCTGPKPPKLEGVLASLVMDARAGDQSFPDWCGDFGYSEDSITALDTYRACCRIDMELRRIFTHTERRALEDALQDY